MKHSQVYKLTCKVCGFNMAMPARTSSEARSLLQRDGWRTVPGLGDTCPRCAKIAVGRRSKQNRKSLSRYNHQSHQRRAPRLSAGWGFVMVAIAFIGGRIVGIW